MKTNHLLAAFITAASIAVAAESNLPVLPLSGIPDLAELSGSLGVEIWRFRVALPAGTGTVEVAFEHYIDGQGTRPLTKFTLGTPLEAREKAMTQDITLSIAPLNGGAGEALTNARNLIFRCARGTETAANPFSRQQGSGGLTISNTPIKVDPSTYYLMKDDRNELRVRITPKKL